MVERGIRTIAVSRQRGSGGSYVARHVAERLGFRYLDRGLLREACAYLHDQKPDHEQAPPPVSSWWPRLVKAFSLGSPAGVYVPPSDVVSYEGDLFEVEKTLIRDVTADHSAVIVGRGAAQMLGGRPGVLTIFVHAPEGWRAQRVQQVYGMPDPGSALSAVRRSDRDRTAFVRRLTGTDWADHARYDLAVDTSATGFDEAIDLIVRAALAPVSVREAPHAV